MVKQSEKIPRKLHSIHSLGPIKMNKSVGKNDVGICQIHHATIFEPSNIAEETRGSMNQCHCETYFNHWQNTL